MPLPRLLIALVAAFSLAPASAQAVDRVVDDDKVQCPHAAFTDVQSAVDAAQYGDVVRVCRGTYAAQVVVPYTKSNLKLVSAPAGAAVLTAPPGGIDFVGDVPLAILVSYARGLYVHGFAISGPLGPSNDEGCFAHTHASGIAVLEGRTTIDGVRIEGTVADCRRFVPGCEPGDPCLHGIFGAGVHTGNVDGSFRRGAAPLGFRGESGVVVDRSIIRGTQTGVLMEGGGAGPVTVQRSTLEGPSDPNPPDNEFNTVGIGAFEIFADADTEVLKIQSNEISGWDFGVWNIFQVEGLVRIVGNRIDDSFAGIDIDSGFNRIERNRVTRGAFGISLGALGNEYIADVRENVVRDALSLGIGIFSEPFCSETRCRPLVRDNSALRSGAVDCFDPARAGRWTRNTGASSLPEDLCRPPATTAPATLRAARVSATPDEVLRDLGEHVRSSHEHPKPRP